MITRRDIRKAKQYASSYLVAHGVDYIIRTNHLRIGRCQPSDSSWTVECWDKFGGYGFGSASTPNLAKRKAIWNYLYRSHLRYLTGERI